jgi:3-isopropylmalate/(R)-2-methylmalate dehydratase small subunit
MSLDGRAFKFGDDINTDYIISAKYKGMTKSIKEMSRYMMQDIDPDLVKRIKTGDFIVAGQNFGCGSSREAAPLVIKARGISAVLAQSFGRIFFRNAINVGLPVLECDTEKIRDGDRLKLDLQDTTLVNVTTGEDIAVAKLPKFIRGIIEAGGLLNYLKTGKLEVV